MEAATGKQAWAKEGLFAGGNGSAYAGTIVMGKNLLILTDGGRLLIIAADPSGYHEISAVQVCGTNWCNPAYADGKLYLRDGREMWCVGLMP